MLVNAELVPTSSELEEREQRIERALRHAWYETALEYEAIRERRLYRRNGSGKRGWETWADYCQERWGRPQNKIDEQIARALEISEIVRIGTISGDQLPSSMSHATELAKLEAPKQRAEVWSRVLSLSVPITAKVVEAEVVRYKAELDKDWITLEEWQALSQSEQRRILTQQYAGTKTFNETNDNIEWAAWSWNPVTGCLHGCEYCYARDIANRFYPYRFEPAFLPNRLSAPKNTRVGQPRWHDDIGYRGVFVGSMCDQFGAWVPQEWLDAVMEQVRAAPQWTFIFLTKNPARLPSVQWPDNAWVGTTVDIRARLKPAQEAFSQVNASVRFLSCEPLREDLHAEDLTMFDWVIIGGQSQSSGAPAMQPEWDWVWSLHRAAEGCGCAVYWKPNLTVRSRQYPTDRHGRVTPLVTRE